ncbi:MAG: hypothetical protein ACYDAR_04815, partial [Thermomicrobiales bacterium]
MVAQEQEPQTSEQAVAPPAQPSHPAVQAIQQRIGTAVEEVVTFRDEITVRIEKGAVHDALQLLR